MVDSANDRRLGDSVATFAAERRAALDDVRAPPRAARRSSAGQRRLRRNLVGSDGRVRRRGFRRLGVPVDGANGGRNAPHRLVRGRKGNVESVAPLRDLETRRLNDALNSAKSLNLSRRRFRTALKSDEFSDFAGVGDAERSSKRIDFDGDAGFMDASNESGRRFRVLSIY